MKTIQLTVWQQIILTTRIKEMLALEQYRQPYLPAGSASSTIPALEDLLAQLA